VLAHLDLDAFFAAVEELENPALVNKPVVVGGDPHGRGVVATANYEARRYGIHSAMSSAEALRRCPHAVFVRPTKGVYGHYSRQVWQIVGELVERVEQVGADEGYLDLGTDDVVAATALARRVQAEVATWTTLTCSLGVATSKVVAKVASDRDKPHGLVVVPPGEEAAFLAPFPVRLLPGVGPRGEERLKAAGITTIGALAALSDAELAEVWRGKIGPLLRERAWGRDPRVVSEPKPSVSYSQEETFEVDVRDRAQLRAEIQRMSEHLAGRLQKYEQAARTVTTKLRYPDFTTLTRQKTGWPTDSSERIAFTANLLLVRALAERDEPLRLVGVSVSGLVEQWQLSLFDAVDPEGVAALKSGEGLREAAEEALADLSVAPVLAAGAG
jgi:DNA polymerase-4